MSDNVYKIEPGAEASIPAAETPKTESLMGLATGVVIIAALVLAREILVPIVLAVFLCFVLAPVVKLLQRLRAPKPVAVAMAVLLAFAVIVAMGWVIAGQVGSLVSNLPQYQTTIMQKFTTVQQTVTKLEGSVAQSFHEQAPKATGGNSLGNHQDGQQPVPVVIESSSFSSLETAKQIIAPILSPLSTLAIVIIVSIFFLMQQADLRDRAIRLAGSSDLHRTTEAIDDATQRLTRYFLTQAAINTTFGIVIGAGLFFIGVPSPVLWGLLAALLRFVPYIGSFISAALPIALAAAATPGWSAVLWTAGLFAVAEGLTGQLLEPMLYGSSTGLSPSAVVVVAIFWSWVWGPVGLILSTPITLCLVVLGRHVRHLEFFDVIFGDRPALTPVETFHQRILAGDPAAILENAESMLKTRALSSYYDDVAFKALRLLCSDVYRGAIKPPQLARIREDLEAMVGEFEAHDDIDPDLTEKEAKAATVEVAGVTRAERDNSPPPPGQAELPPEDMVAAAWRNPRSILCVPGEGPFDEVAASVIAQLLRKHGLGAQALLWRDVARNALGSLNDEGVEMLCVIYLDIAGNQPRMRYLLRRLSQRFIGRPMLVGFWPSTDAAPVASMTQSLTGNVEFVDAARDITRLCLAHAQRPAALAVQAPL